MVIRVMFSVSYLISNTHWWHVDLLIRLSDGFQGSSKGIIHTHSKNECTDRNLILEISKIIQIPMKVKRPLASNVGPAIL